MMTHHPTRICLSLRTRALAAIVALLAVLFVPARAVAEEAEGYQGGSIPIMRITFHDDVDPETGEVILSGDEKLMLVNESPDHSYKAEGVTVDLEVPAGYDNPETDLWDGVSGYTGEVNLSLEFIRGRGNTTWRFDKRPYKLKFDDRVDFFGLGANKHWALLANYKDESLTINRMIGWLGDQLGMPFSPRGVPVDLFMNGEYYGSYLLIEEVRVDAGRVDIDVVDEDAGDPDSLDITGDYFIGWARKISALSYEYFETSRGTIFSYDTPEYEIPLTAAEEAQQAYLVAHLDRVEDAIFSEGLTSDAGESAWDFIDMASLADYWWVQEFTTNPDAFMTPSTYFYKQRDQVAADGSVEVGKIFWGPLWDFDIIWGQLAEEGFDNTRTDWTSLLRQDPAFVALLKERWLVLDSVLEELTREGGMLDGYAAEMAQSWEANREYSSWDDLHDWADGSYQETIEELRNHIDARRAWINAHLDELQTTYFSIVFMDGDEKVSGILIEEGSSCWVDAPAVPLKDGLLFEGWFDEDGVEYARGTVFDQDKVFSARWTDASSVTAATDIFLANDELWITRASRVRYELVPDDARDQRIAWSSSDESIVTVDANGFVTPAPGCLDDADVAEATVTARLVGSGAEVTVRVVVYNQFVVDMPEPTSIEFEDGVELEVGEYRQLSWTAEPEPNALDAYFDLEFEVDDASVAEVSPLGVVTGKAPGTVTISVLRMNPDTYKHETVATVSVTVAAAPEPEPEPEPEPDPEPEPAPEPADDEVFSIVFSLNGGTMNGSTADVVMQCKKGEIIAIPAAPTRDGYTFLYWKGSEYHPGDAYEVVGDHTFTAQWRLDESPVPKTGDETGWPVFIVAIGVAIAAVGVIGYAFSADNRSKQR